MLYLSSGHQRLQSFQRKIPDFFFFTLYSILINLQQSQRATNARGANSAKCLLWDPPDRELNEVR